MGTKAEPPSRRWRINDLVTGLGLFASNKILSLAGRSEWTVGSGPDCTLRIADPTGATSGKHARLTCKDNIWTVHDLASTNGTEHDGHVSSEFDLVPGSEISLGGVVLIARSELFDELRAYVARLLGWKKLTEIDVALGGIRDAAIRRNCLVLCGAGDLTPIARELHRHVVGADAAFIVADPADGASSLARAANGTLCMDASSLPGDLELVMALARRESPRVRLVVCADSATEAAPALAKLRRTTLLQLPDLSTRREELDLVIHEFAADAVRVLGTDGTGFREHEMTWLRPIKYKSLSDLAETMLRVVAIRNLGVRGAARRLGMDHGNLSRWAKRRRIPT